MTRTDQNLPWVQGPSVLQGLPNTTLVRPYIDATIFHSLVSTTLIRSGDLAAHHQRVNVPVRSCP
jgi:hypothetical protein